jgi:glycosyltransferase involved in cell wall biosynthesis
MPPLVAVVIPSYNYGRFISDSVESVLRQTYSPIELIVVNDGSTDDTEARLRRYGDRLRVITQPNSGLSAARNTGIHAAAGEFIAFLDADDWWEPEKIGRQVEVLCGRPELGAVGCGERQVDANGREFGLWIQPEPGVSKTDTLRMAVQRRFWIGGSGSGILARREVFDEVGLFDPSLAWCEDWDMWLRIIDRYPVWNLPDVLTNRRWHGTGTYRRPAMHEEFEWLFYQRVVERWPDVMDARTRRQMRSVIHADIGGEYLHLKDPFRALPFYYRAAREWPYCPRAWYIVTRVALRCGLLRARGATAS